MANIGRSVAATKTWKLLTSRAHHSRDTVLFQSTIRTLGRITKSRNSKQRPNYRNIFIDREQLYMPFGLSVCRKPATACEAFPKQAHGSESALIRWGISASSTRTICQKGPEHYYTTLFLLVKPFITGG